MKVSAEEAWLHRLDGQIADKTDVVLLVQRKSDMEPLGVTGLHDIHWLARWAEFGVLLGREHWGQGYGREVTERMLEYAFLELNLNAVRLRVNAGHEEAVRCYEHAGYQQEGRLREAAVVRGQPEDMLVMSLLRAEWQANQDNAPSILA